MASGQWWTPSRIEKTVTYEFITQVLDPKYHRGLKARVYDDDLSDDTYQEVILTKARACFLILRDVGSPELIFEFIDRNFTDDDLPIPDEDEAAWQIIVSIKPRLDEKFDARQFYYCLQELQPDVHINYTPDDIVPVTTVARGIHRGSATVKRVIASNKELFRRKYLLEVDDTSEEHAADTESFEHYFRELNVLQHTNITRVWTTYTQDEYGYVLYGPPSTDTLKDALMDSTKYFKSSTKEEQRQVLLRWAFCMACALDYLHQHGLSHQAIRPANIYLDSTMNMSLGECAAYDDFNGRPADFERLQYLHGSPEQWQRKRQVLQATGQNMAPSGGRSARPDPSAQPASRLSAAFFKRRESKSTNTRESKSARPMSPLSTFPRSTSRPVSAGRGSVAPSLKSSSDSSVDSTQGHAPSNLNSKPSKRTIHARSESAASGNGNGVYENPTRPRKTLVTSLNFSHLQTSSHDQSPLFPSDVFAAATILVEILTVLLATSSSSFSLPKLVAHLGRRNRQAGRGGGGGAPADSSFHANLDQANSWLDGLSKGVAEVLHKAAKKRSKSKTVDSGEQADDTHWLHATAQLIELARRGLEADPWRRISAADFHAGMVRINDRHALNAGHCCGSQAPAIESARTRQNSIPIRIANSSTRNSVSTGYNGSGHGNGSVLGTAYSGTSNGGSSARMSVIDGFSPTNRSMMSSAYTESTNTAPSVAASEFNFGSPSRPASSSASISSSSRNFTGNYAHGHGPNPGNLPLVPELEGESEYIMPTRTFSNNSTLGAASPSISVSASSDHGIIDMANMQVVGPDRYDHPATARPPSSSRSQHSRHGRGNSHELMSAERHELPSPESEISVSPELRRRDTDAEIEPNDSLYEYFSDDGEEGEGRRGSRGKREREREREMERVAEPEQRPEVPIPSLREIPLPAAWKGKRFAPMKAERHGGQHGQGPGHGSQHSPRYEAIGQAM